MKTPGIPTNETDRIADLAGYGVLDTPFEKDFDDLVKLAATICEMPMSLISFVDSERQWFKAAFGVPLRQTDRDYSFCAHAILQEQSFIVPDTAKDERFSDNPLVTGGPKIRFYAGIPLLSFRGHRMGTLCVLDSIPRTINGAQLAALVIIRDQVTRLLEFNRMYKQLAGVSTVHHRLLNLLTKEFKSPFSAVGSLLNLLQGQTWDKTDLQPVARKTGGVFQSGLDLLDSLVEWGRIHQDRWSSRPLVQHPVSYFADLFGFMTRKDIFRGYSFHVRLDDSVDTFLAGNALQFVIRNVLRSLCECAKGGEITAHGLRQWQRSMVAYITLVSPSILPEMDQRIQTINDPAVWPEQKHEPIRAVELLLAKDVLEEIRGVVRTRFDGKTVVAIEIEIPA